MLKDLFVPIDIDHCYFAVLVSKNYLSIFDSSTISFLDIIAINVRVFIINFHLVTNPLDSTVIAILEHYIISLQIIEIETRIQSNHHILVYKGQQLFMFRT